MRPLKCPHGPILTNVTLTHELRAGKFSRLGLADDMETCIQMCCDKDDCEMAFMPGKHCYGVDCFSQEHCEITTVKPSNLTVQIAAVRPIVVNPAKDQIAGKAGFILKNETVQFATLLVRITEVVDILLIRIIQ